MPNRTHSLLTALLAALLLATAVGGADANRLAVNETGFVFHWRDLSITGGGSTIICDIVLRGAFHSRTVTKTGSALIGIVTSATRNSCQGDGEATLLSATLPWHVTYGGFGGRLPSITSFTVNIINASIAADDFTPCLFASSSGEPWRLIPTVASGSVTGIWSDDTATIDLGGGFLCELGGDARIAGHGAVTTANGGTLIVSLV